MLHLGNPSAAGHDMDFGDSCCQRTGIRLMDNLGVLVLRFPSADFEEH